MSAEELIPQSAQRPRPPHENSRVGRKTAERMVVELKDKLEAIAIANRSRRSFSAGVEADVISALVNLGYDGRTAENAVSEAKREVGISILKNC